MDGSEHSVSIVRRQKDSLIISVDGKMFWVKQSGRNNSSVTFLVGSKLVGARIKGSESSTFPQNSTKSEVASVSDTVTSNFPAKVVKVNIKKGDRVKENETLIVLEAMKMEAQIKTPKSCIVSEVFVKEGQMVERGKLMVTLEFDS